MTVQYRRYLAIPPSSFSRMELKELTEAIQSSEPQSTSSMEKTKNSMLESLPDDLVIDIYCRLPVKYIARLRCVSKSLYKLTTEDHYRKMLPPAMSGLFYVSRCPFGFKITFARFRSYNDNTSAVTSLSFLPPRRTGSLSIVGLCNGLFLCRLQGICKEDFHYYHVVCNPATKRWARIPKPKEIVRAMVLGFDPQLSPHYRVLGFYPSDQESSHYNIKVFSSETGEWEDGKDSVSYNVFDNHGNTVYFHGIFHILDIMLSASMIVGIDINGKLCRRIEPPHQVSCDRVAYSQFLGLSGGCLRYAWNSTKEVVIWDLADYNSNEWIRKQQISYQSILEELQPLQYYFGANKLPMCTRPSRLQMNTISSGLQLVAFHPDYDVVFFTLEGAVLSYHMNSKKFKMVTSSMSRSIYKIFVYSPCYLEGLDFVFDSQNPHLNCG